MNIGFIGLGNMGNPIARKLIGKKHRLSVFDLDEARTAALVKEGAEAVKSIKEVAERSDVVFLSLPNQLIVREVALGNGGLLSHMKKGSVLVDLSTSLPSVTREIGRAAQAIGVDILDAPLSGGPEGAEAGNLSIVAGGSKTVFDKALPLLYAFSDPEKCFYAGELGNGHSLKLIHNHLNAITLVAITEALVVGKKAGIDPQLMFDVISVSRGNSGMFQSRAPRMMDGNFKAAFSVDLMYKDLGLAASLAQELKIPVVLGDAARSVYEMARAKGKGADDIAAVVTVLEEWAGVTVRRT